MDLNRINDKIDKEIEEIDSKIISFIKLNLEEMDYQKIKYFLFVI